MVSPSKKNVVVIGAGIGGLTTAIDLARAGLQVTLLERGQRAGGKLRQASVGGRNIDIGPTVLTMRWVFEGLFKDCDRDLDDYVVTRRPEVLARHAWPNGPTLDLHADVQRSADAIGQAFGAHEAKGYLAFSDYARRIYDAAKEPFLLSQRPGALDIARLALTGQALRFARIDAYRSMVAALARFFRDPRLLQLFARYATYCGSSPYLAPATFNLVAHVEREGVHIVEGGMIRLAEGLVRLAQELGVTLRFGAEARNIDAPRGAVRRVELASGEVLEADAVVVNADPSAVAGGLLGNEAARATTRVKRGERSLSALTFAMVGRAEGFDLAHHNVFFSSNYEAEFRSIFEEGRAPSEPTTYVCAPDRSAKHQEIPGENEGFFLIVNAPADGDKNGWGSEEVMRCQRGALSVLSACGLKLSPTACLPTTPRDFDRRFPGSGGAIYGAAAHSPLAPLSRPAAKTKLGGMYLAGGAAHPGPGVPMAALSGRLAAEAVLNDLASTRGSRRMDTRGSISMS